MARKPIPPDEHRQRTLEGPEDGPLRSRLRDADESRVFRARLLAGVRTVALWVSAVGAAVYLMRDVVVAFVRTMFTEGGGQ